MLVIFFQLMTMRTISKPCVMSRMGLQKPTCPKKAAIVTSGGTCPGLNTVVHEITHALESVGCRDVFAVKHGYSGFYTENIVKISSQDTKQHRNEGGTFIGTSRTPFETMQICNVLSTYNIDHLYVVGGDGSLAGALQLSRCSSSQIIGIPKTIDNDIPHIDYSFGFHTAVEESVKSLEAMHRECIAFEGIGVVQLMGRQCGMIATHATQASGYGDIVLVPEKCSAVDTKQIAKQAIHHRSQNKSCVVVVSEGLGRNIGWKIVDELYSMVPTVSIKYMDPSYLVRAGNPNCFDMMYCTELSQAAVSAACGGFTGLYVGKRADDIACIPLEFLNSL